MPRPASGVSAASVRPFAPLRSAALARSAAKKSRRGGEVKRRGQAHFSSIGGAKSRHLGRAEMSFSLVRSRACLFAGAAAVTFIASSASAAEKQFSIAPQALSSALQAFGRQSGETILYRSEMTSDVRSPGAIGTLSPEAALARILSGSRFEFRKVDQGFVVVPAATPDDRPQLIKTVAQAAAPRPSIEPAPAPAPPPAAAVEEVVVTGSRITTTGYRQPTPVTVVGEAQIQRDAKVSIGDVIRELPAVGASSSPNNGGGAGNIVAAITGVDTINLRQLGITRTLVLFDSQRVVQSNITGGVDLGTIPTALVQRIDVVTGGASAAWGSDAVAGVVNLVLNKNFDGIRASVEGGDSFKGDHKSLRLSFAGGTGFADDRGRIIVAGNYLTSPDTVFPGQRDWYHTTQLVNNPAWTATNGQPRLIHADNIGLSQATTGGLITAGPLKGIQFVGPNATPRSFNFGNVSGPISNGGDAETLHPSIDNLTVEYKTSTLFGYLSWKLTDNITASLQANYGETWSRNNSVPAVRLGNLTIRNDNAYLPASIKALMAQNNVTTLPFGTTNMNNITPGDLSLDKFEKALGIPVAITERALSRFVASLEGDINEDWSWDAYYQKGQVLVHQYTRSNVITANYNLAIDAVVNPANGQVVCRSTLTNPTNGCVPLNIFGNGVATPAAIAYVNVKPGQNFQDILLIQDVAAVSTEGKLPFGFEAGPVAVAFGAEMRQEKGKTVTDPGAAARLYSVANFSPFRGSYKVKEAFAEAEVPLIEDGFVRSAALNFAGRVTDYSTSGTVRTWKVGLTSQISDDIRIRGTVSQDIRAPNLSELFNSGTSTLGSAVDPKTGINVSIFTVGSGNPNLKPEEAKTISGGVVLSPTFAPRLNLSLDYYSIDIQGAIFSVGSSTVLANCNAGQTAYCAQLDFNGPNGALSQIRTFPLNVSSQKTEGVDFQVDYSLPVGDGNLALRMLGNYILTQRQEQLGASVDYRGSIGSDSSVQGVPILRTTTSATYTRDKLSLTAQVRYIGEALLNRAWTSADVDDNSVPRVGYFDLRGSYDVRDDLTVYGAVDNLTNVDPPTVAASPAQGQSAYYFTAVRGTIYDTIGRSYRIGVRVKY
jgi:outer membrane receptor protein involved in Fe transport